MEDYIRSFNIMFFRLSLSLSELTSLYPLPLLPISTPLLSSLSLLSVSHPSFPNRLSPATMSLLSLIMSFDLFLSTFFLLSSLSLFTPASSSSSLSHYALRPPCFFSLLLPLSFSPYLSMAVFIYKYTNLGRIDHLI